MNQVHVMKVIAVAAASLVLAACASGPTRPAGADAARAKLTRLQSDPELASRAPVAIGEADVAVRAAEVPQKETDASRHLVLIADRKVDTARAQAEARLAEDQRKTLSEQRETARLDARTREADAAHVAADSARADADVARDQADASRTAEEAAQRKAAELQLQIDALNAKATDRGLIVTLGDLLFETGRADLKGGAASNLSRLAAFLNQYPDRTVMIEGHTDNVGADDYNFNLSQQRADSVRSYLVGQGIASARLTSSGKGENSPVAGNDSATGRQQNRRVEVIIANTVASAG